jgi:proteic killer suppression protein
MIKSFSHKGLENFFCDGTKKGIQPKHADKIGDILDRLDAATVIGDIKFPGSGLHLLEPKRKGKWAVKVSCNWRIAFKFREGDAYEVDYVDYH